MAEPIIVKCKNCGQDMPLDELLESQIVQKHKEHLVKDLREREDSLKKATQEFEAKVALARANYKDELMSKTKQIEAEVKARLNDSFKSKLDSYELQLSELKNAVKSAEKTELELRQENSSLQQQKETMDLEIARKVAQELEKTRRQALELNEQQHKIELLEKEHTISQLNTLIDNLNKKARQGSQQAQGEAGEILVEDVLRREFITDEIQPVAKGQAGADIIFGVMDKRGIKSGKLLIEVKRTKTWSNCWIDKIKKDQFEARADIPIIISEALPDMSGKKIANINGVWVCGFAVYRELILTLRHQLIRFYRLSLSKKNEDSKAAMVYSYVNGIEFKQTVSEIMDSLKLARDNLEHEKSVMLKSWSKREKLIERISYSSIKISSDFEFLTGSVVEDDMVDPKGGGDNVA